jgi:hypothetical protein
MCQMGVVDDQERPARKEAPGGSFLHRVRA